VIVARRLIIEREPFLRRFVARFDPPLVSDQPQRFTSRDEALTPALAIQKRDGVVLVDLSA
jgi:hypothetical protein